MNKLSKAFYLTSIIGVFTFGAIVAIVGTIFPEPFGLVPIFIGIICYIYSLAVWNLLIYRMWQSIQDGYARTTPALAVGFLFVPYYNLYWIFQAVWGFTKDCNRYIDRHQIVAPKLSEKLALAFCIVALFWLCGLPIIGLIIDIFPAIGEWVPSRFCIMSFFLFWFCGLPSIELIINAFLMNQVCDTVNLLPQPSHDAIRRCEEMIGNNPILHKYITRQGIQRFPMLVLINVLMGIGFLAVIASPFIPATAMSKWGAFASGAVRGTSDVFAFAFPSAVYFILFGWLGGCLTAIIMAVVVFGGIYSSVNPAMYVPVWLVYIIGWTYVNFMYSKYTRVAKEKIDIIAKEASPKIEHILEKGILQQIILWQNEPAVVTLKLALSMEGGDALLWYLAGVAFANMKMYSEALTAFDKAMEASPDAKIIGQIRRSQRTVQRRMR